VRVLDAPDGEAGVLHRPVLLPHVPGLVRANVHECFSPAGEHQLPCAVGTGTIPRAGETVSCRCVRESLGETR
jgi:hypothetical protein